MGLGSHDQRILDDLRRAGEEHPDLGTLLCFYEQLFHLQFSFKARLKEHSRAGFPVDRGIDPALLASGTPQVGFDELRIEAAPFMDLFRNIATLLIRETGYPAPEDGEPGPEKILAFARKIFESRVPLAGADRTADLVGAASALVLAPYLQLAGENIMPRIPPEAWDRGYCPVCGGTPSFAVAQAEPAFRTLLCSRCNSEWRFRRLGCPFCLERDHQTYYTGEEEGYRLYVCEACQRYLKTFDMRESAAERCLPVESIATVAMDVAAQEKGFMFF